MEKLGKKEKLNEVKESSAQIIIGKNGLTENIKNTIILRLKKEKIVKIKMLKTAVELKNMARKEFAELIAKEVNAKLLDIRGYNLIIQKKGI